MRGPVLRAGARAPLLEPWRRPCPALPLSYVSLTCAPDLLRRHVSRHAELYRDILSWEWFFWLITVCGSHGARCWGWEMHLTLLYGSAFTVACA
jgi:hypothetical protein